jgi:hypothetical protein
VADDGVQIRLSTVGAEDITAALTRITQGLDGLQEKAKAAVGPDLVTAVSAAVIAFGQLADGIGRVVGKFEEMIASTVEARAEHEQFEIRIASLLKQTDSWGNSLDRSRDVLGKLELVSAATGEATEGLVKTFRDLGVLTGGTTDQIVNLTKQLSIAAAMAGTTSEAFASVIQRASTTGQLPMRGGGGRELRLFYGVTGEDLQNAQRAGDLMQYLTEHMKANADQADTLANSWTVLFHSIDVATEDLKAGIGEVWEPFKFVLADLRDALMSGDFQQGVTSIVVVFRSLFEALTSTAKTLIEMDQALLQLVGTFSGLNSVIGDHITVLGAISAPLKVAVSMWIVVLGTLREIATVLLGLGTALTDLGKGQFHNAARDIEDTLDAVKQVAIDTAKEIQNVWTGGTAAKPADQSLPPANLIDQKKINDLMATLDELRKKTSEQWDLAGLKGIQKQLEENAIAADNEIQHFKDIAAQAQKLGKEIDVGPDIVLIHATQYKKDLQALEDYGQKWRDEFEKQSYAAYEKGVKMEEDYQALLTTVRKKAADDQIAQMQAAADAEKAALNKKVEEFIAKEKLTDDQLLALRQALGAAKIEIDKQEALKEAEALALRNQNWTAYYNALRAKADADKDYSLKTEQEIERKVADGMVANAVTVEQGLAAGISKFRAAMTTIGQDVAAAVAAIGASLTSTLSTGFFDIVTGKLSDLGATFKKFGEDILKAITDVFAKIVERWLLTVIGIEQNPIKAGVAGSGSALGLGGNAPSAPGGTGNAEDWGMSGAATGGGGMSPLLGAAGMAGAFAFGLGMNTMANAQTTGQMIGGGMETVGGAALMAGVAATAAHLLVVPVYGWIAAAALVIIGAIISIFSKPPEIKVSGDALRPQIETVAHNLQANLLDVYASSMMKDSAGFAGGMDDVVARYLARISGFQVHAGSASDVQADIKNLLTNVVPSELLHEMIGQQGVGVANLPGIYGGTTYGGQLDPNAPINKMLTDLGFTAGKIQELAGQIDQMSATDWIKQLNEYVAAVAGLADASKKLGRSFADISADQAKTAAQSPAEAMADSVSKLVDEAKTLALYTGADQAQRTQTWLQSVQQVIAAEEQAIAQINAMIVAIGDQSKALHTAVDAALRTPAEQLAFIAGKLPDDFAAIMAAANPTDLQKAWNTFLSDSTTVVNALVARIQTIEALQQQVSAFFAAVVAGPGADPTKNPFAYLVQNAAQIQTVTKAMQGALSGSQEQVGYAQQLLGLLQQRYAFELQKLQEVNDAITSIGQSIQSQIFGLQQQGRSPHDQGVAMWDQVNKLYASLSGAKSPQEVTSIVGQIQQLITQLASQPQDPANAAAARQILIDMLNKTQAEADRVLKAMGAALQSDIDKLPAQINTIVTTLHGALATVQADLTKTLKDFDSAAAAAAGKLTDFGTALTDEMTPLVNALNALKDAITGVTKATQTGQPTTPMPTTDPGTGNKWQWDPTSGKWITVPATPTGGGGGGKGGDGVPTA